MCASLLIASCCFWQQSWGYFSGIQNQYYEKNNFATARTMCVSDVEWQPKSRDLLQAITDSRNSLLPLWQVYAKVPSSNVDYLLLHMSSSQCPVVLSEYQAQVKCKVKQGQLGSVEIFYFVSDNEVNTSWTDENPGQNHPPSLAAGMWFKRLEALTHSMK